MRIVFIIIIIISLFACNIEKANETRSKSTDVIVVEDYFNFLYNQRNFEKVIELSSVNNKKIVENYSTVKNLTRTLYNLSFDSVEVYVQESNKTPFYDEKYDIMDKKIMAVSLTGYQENKIIKDYIEVIIVLESGRWKVDEIVKDKVFI